MFSTIVAYIGIAVEYIISACLIFGGLYLAAIFNLAATNPLAWILRPLRFAGYAMVAAGLILGAFTAGNNYGTVNGGALVEAQWQQKNYEAQIAKLQQESQAKTAAVLSYANQSKQLASQNDDLQNQIADYQTAEANSAVCRRATSDDDARLCKLTGNGASGCQHSK